MASVGRFKNPAGIARAAMEKCKLARIYFVTAHVPPHKQLQPLSPFLHRYAMVALATAAEKTFIPSLLEAPEEFSGREPATTVGKGKDKDRTPKPNYTIETVRRLKQGTAKPRATCGAKP